MKLIACIDLDFGIGYNGQLLFHIPEDMKRFRDLTIGKVVVMGSNTYEGIGHGLNNRTNIIITNNKEKYQSHLTDNIYIMNMDEFIHNYYDTLTKEEQDNVYVIGGAEIYNSLIPLCDTLELTRVNTVSDNCDRFIKNLAYDYGLSITSNNKYLNLNSDKKIRYELTDFKLNIYSTDADVFYDFLTYKRIN